MRLLKNHIYIYMFKLGFFSEIVFCNIYNKKKKKKKKKKKYKKIFF